MMAGGNPKLLESVTIVSIYINHGQSNLNIVRLRWCKCLGGRGRYTSWKVVGLNASASKGSLLKKSQSKSTSAIILAADLVH